MSTKRVVQEQINYYRERAAEYDEWWERKGRYDFGEDFNAAWRADIQEAACWLHAQDLGESVLEIAGGTGNWSSHLAANASELWVLDSSPEMLGICELKLGSTEGVRATVSYVVSDVFDYEPGRRFETIFSAFWISHIPNDLWDAYWKHIARMLVPGGRVVIIESADPAYARRFGPEALARHQDAEVVLGAAGNRRLRMLNSGIGYQVEKHYWTPQALSDEFLSNGWRMTVLNTHFAFLCGIGSPLGHPSKVET